MKFIELINCNKRLTNRLYFMPYTLVALTKKNINLVLMTLVIISCNKAVDRLPDDKLFTQIPPDISGVNFENKILESEDLYYYKYLYMYLGGGVAAADFNNDGLEDLFFTSNTYQNRLFLNKGDFVFEDITDKAGFEKSEGFDVGVSIADVNSDGFLDIYINRAGWYEEDDKLANQLYINNGDLTFTEQASTYGLADTNRSIASTFFDYDNDGDLDLYIANAPSRFGLSSAILDLDNVQKHPMTTTFKGSDKLYNNNGDGYFTDVSVAAGILPDLGFGLNAQVGDLNNDGWLDIYVSNDFVGSDYVYVNNGDGTFSDGRDELFKHISYYSMGGDIADINNDGLTDLMVLDMNPEDYIRSKTTMGMSSIERFDEMIEKNYYYQYMHNTMHLNNGNGTYSDIAYMSGLAMTDWSWATLFADFDLDGFNDVYVTNGVYRDVMNKDVVNKIDKYLDENEGNLSDKKILELTQMLPQQKLTNYFFKNKGNLDFEKKTEDWANETPSFSNGAIYSDLDNDGDLDIVVNNIDAKVTILRNNSREQTRKNYVQFKFNGPEKNPQGVGVTVKLYNTNGQIQTRQLINSRGYLSSVSSILHFGLGDKKSIDKMEVIWPDGKTQLLEDVPVNQVVAIDYTESKESGILLETKEEGKLFKEQPLELSHVEAPYNDFDKQLLLPHKLSQTGPAIAKADIDNDGLEDIFIGGASNQSGQLLFAQQENTFKAVFNPSFEKDKAYEDVGACFFDADNDGDKDLYVVSGSYEFDMGSPKLKDRLYINDGKGNFNRSNTELPTDGTAGSVVVASDYDNDGDEDLFVGGRVIPGKYPYAPTSYLLINDNGSFKIGTKTYAPELENIGMVTDASWNDIDNDGDVDLIVTGEWMGIEVFTNENGHLSKNSAYNDLSSAKGWWNTIVIEDIDGDGDKDILAGNLGLNYKFHASNEKPFHIYTHDFDNNGIEDIVLAKYYKKEQVPVRGKSCTSAQMPFLKEKFKKYEDFANADINDIFGEDIEYSLHYLANEFRSGIFRNEGGKGFIFEPFSNEAQISPINSILYEDFDGDMIKDLLLAGNNYMPEIETTRADAGKGVFYKGQTNRHFSYVDNQHTGFFANKDVRKMVLLKSKNSKNVFVVNNNDKQQLFSME